MTGVPTDTTDDVCREVLGLGTVVFAMTDLSAILAGLVLVVTKGTVESCELTKLISLQLILSFGDRGRLNCVKSCQM
jgi:hypothetical protein